MPRIAIEFWRIVIRRQTPGKAIDAKGPISADFVVAARKVAPAAVIDKRYPLSEVAEAIRYLEGEHARGKVVITTDTSTALASS